MTNLPCQSTSGKPRYCHTASLTQSTDAIDAETPLNPAELQVLRAQYEKEGDMVGVQTKFNYAWVSLPRSRLSSDQLG